MFRIGLNSCNRGEPGNGAILEQVLQQSLGDGATDVFVLRSLRLDALGSTGDLIFPDFRKLLYERNEPGHLGSLLSFGRNAHLVALPHIFRPAPSLIFLPGLIQGRFVYTVYLAYIHCLLQ